MLEKKKKNYFIFFKEIVYPTNLLKSWNDDVLELIKTKQKKSKILSKIQNKIKDLLPKSQRSLIWKQVQILKRCLK